MRHRGPDAGGEYVSAGMYMGHRRLKIIDLSEKASQPFCSSDGRYILSFNGEIYNYLELREELKLLGCVFRTQSDTEVFLEAFRVWGASCFNRFDGMFAAAIHDRLDDVHYLVRDHFGQKPLYFTEQKDFFAYASELRAILSLNFHSWRIDRDAFRRFIANSCYYWNNSPIEGVYKLLPGHFLRLAADGVSDHCYFDSRPGRNMLDIDDDLAGEEVWRLFHQSCEMAMRSDVPYGVFLSGGIDSALLYTACHQINPDVRAFCVAMEERDYDESHKAKSVLAHFNSQTHRFFTQTKASFLDTFATYFQSLDEPHGDPGCVNSYFLALSCKPEITVALCGNGADEVFAGYPPFWGLYGAVVCSVLPTGVLRALRKSVSSIIPASDGYLGVQFKLLNYLHGFPAPEPARFQMWLQSIFVDELAALCPGEPEFYLPTFFKGTLFDYLAEFPESFSGMSSVQRLLYFYQKVFLPEMICMDTDRATMQSSLEVRSPYLSVPLVEFVNRLPDRLKIQKLHLKVLPKRLLALQGVPRNIVTQKKQGFTLPVARWMKTILRDHVTSLLHEEMLEGLVDVDILRIIVDAHLSGKRNYYRVILNLIAFCYWRKNFPYVS